MWNKEVITLQEIHEISIIILSVLSLFLSYSSLNLLLSCSFLPAWFLLPFIIYQWSVESCFNSPITYLRFKLHLVKPSCSFINWRSFKTIFTANFSETRLHRQYPSPKAEHLRKLNYRSYKYKRHGKLPDTQGRGGSVPYILELWINLMLRPTLIPMEREAGWNRYNRAFWNKNTYHYRESNPSHTAKRVSSLLQNSFGHYASSWRALLKLDHSHKRWEKFSYISSATEINFP